MRQDVQETVQAIMAAAMFPTKEVFDKEMEKIEADAIPWRDLQIDAIYRIEGKSEVPAGKFGRGLILNVKDVDGNSIRVWATSLIVKRLMPIGEEEMKLPCFIRPRGMRKCKGDANRSYQAFQLLPAESMKC